MTIGEASEKTGLSADTLRYYEKIGLIPPVPRRENGLRDYGAETIKLVALIQRLKETGMQLETCGSPCSAAPRAKSAASSSSKRAKI